MSARASRPMQRRTIYFTLFSAAALALFFLSLREAAAPFFRSDQYSYVVLVPFIGGYFLFIQRKGLFQTQCYAPFTGILVIAVASAIYLFGTEAGLGRNDYFSMMTFSLLVMLVGGFIFFYGMRALKAASFPFAFLIFMVPVPSLLMDPVVHFLRVGSTEAANAILKMTGAPFIRDGFCFYLPGLGIEVADECSGIRSAISLVITSVVAGKLFLDTRSRRVAIALLAIPIAIVKNGMRIVTLFLLGDYVDKRVLSSSLHKYGGIPFFLLGLLLLGAVLWALRKSEGRGNKERTPLAATPAEDNE